MTLFKLKKTPKLFKAFVDPYRFYVDMYGTPSYDDIDIDVYKRQQ